MLAITNNKVAAFVLGLFVALMGFVLPGRALAFSLAPASNDVHVYSGESVTARIIVDSGASDSSADVFLRRAEIGADNKLSFSEVKDSPLAPKLDVTSLEMKSGERKEVRLQMTAPTEGEGRDIFAVAVRDRGPKLSRGSVGVHTEIVSLLFVSYGPTVPEDAALRSVTLRSSRLARLEDVSIAVKIENTGHYIVRPTVAVEVKNLFGKTVAVLNREEARLSVPAGEMRDLTYSASSTAISQSPLGAFGFYSVRVHFVPKTGAHVSTDTVWIFVWPSLKLGLLAFSVLVIGILLVRFLKRGKYAKK